MPDIKFFFLNKLIYFYEQIKALFCSLYIEEGVVKALISAIITLEQLSHLVKFVFFICFKNCIFVI